MTKRGDWIICCFVALCMAPTVLVPLSKATHLNSEANQATGEVSQVSQKTFATPKEAANALVQAAASFDVPAMKEILGSDSDDLVESEDTVQDNKPVARRLPRRPAKRLPIAIDSKNPNQALLVVRGDDDRCQFPWSRRTENGCSTPRLGGGGSSAAHRRERGWMQSKSARGSRRGPVKAICIGETHDLSRSESVRATNHQHCGQTGWPGMAECGRKLGRPCRRGSRQRIGARVFESEPTVPRIFLQNLERAKTCGAAGRNGLRRGRRDEIGGFALAAAPRQTTESRESKRSSSAMGAEPGSSRDLRAYDAQHLRRLCRSYNPDKTWRVTDDNWCSSNQELLREIPLKEEPRNEKVSLLDDCFSLRSSILRGCPRYSIRFRQRQGLYPNTRRTWYGRRVPIKGAEVPDDLTQKALTSAIDAQLGAKGLTKTDSDNADICMSVTKRRLARKRSLPHTTLAGATVRVGAAAGMGTAGAWLPLRRMVQPRRCM